MAKKKFVWEVHLRPNTLTKDNDRDCIADVYAHAAPQRNALITNYQLINRFHFFFTEAGHLHNKIKFTIRMFHQFCRFKSFFV